MEQLVNTLLGNQSPNKNEFMLPFHTLLLVENGIIKGIGKHLASNWKPHGHCLAHSYVSGFGQKSKLEPFPPVSPASCAITVIEPVMHNDQRFRRDKPWPKCF
jgi:hypothetical protein